MGALTIPYSASEALFQVRSVINETTADFWADEEINNWIIEGSSLLSVMTHCYEASGDITLVANTFEYASLDGAVSVSTIIKIHAALYYNKTYQYTGLININPRVIGRHDFYTPGPTQGYCMFGDKILVAPVPTATEVTDTAKIKVYYSKNATAITDIPDHLQRFVVDYAIAMAFYKRNKGAIAGQFMSVFLSAAQFERSDLIMQPTDVKGSVVQPDLVV